jgi:hypothetical protein
MKIVLLNVGQASNYVLELDGDGAGKSVLRLRFAATGARLDVRLDHELLLPAELLVEEQGLTRLASLAEIRTRAALEGDKVSPSFNPQALEAKWLGTVADISAASLHAEMATRFLGMTPFPAGASNFSGSVRLNLNACLVDRSAQLQATIEVSADCIMAQGTTSLAARFGWRVSISAAYHLPQLSIRLPGPTLRFPSFDFPNFDLANLRLPASPEFELGFPALPGIPLTLTHGGITLSTVEYIPEEGKLKFSVAVRGAVLHAGGKTCPLGSPELSFANGAVTIGNVETGPFTLEWAARAAAPLPAPLNGLTQELGAGKLDFVLEVDQGKTMLKGYLHQLLTLSPSDQPEKSLTLDLTLPFVDTGFADDVTIGGIMTRRSVELQLAGTRLTLEALLADLPTHGSFNLNLSLPTLPAPQLDALVAVLSAILAAIVTGLAGLARIVESGLRALFDLMRKAASAMRGIDLRLILNARTGHLQQMLLGLHRGEGGIERLVDVPSLSLSAPTDVDLALLIDLRDGERDAYLVATVANADKPLLKFGSDLWFGALDRELQSSDLAVPMVEGAGAAPAKLIEIEVNARADAGATRLSFVPFGIRHGEAVFFYALESPLPAFSAVPVSFTGYQLRSDLGQSITARTKFDEKAKSRFLPFLAVPTDEPSGAGGDSLGDMLKQYIELKTVSSADYVNGVFTSDAKVRLKVMGSTIESDLKLQLDARRMTASVRGGLIKLSLDDTKPFELLGMQGSFVAKDEAAPPLKGEQFVLDMSSGDTRLYLNDAYKMVLDFDRLGKDAAGQPLRFEVVKLVVHGGGMDLEASLAGPYTLRLNGLETDFTFEKARIQVRGGRIESFSLGALGKLPPALLGDVDVRLQLDFGERKDGSVGLLNGAIELKNKGKPIRSEQTHFVLTLEALSVRVFDDGGGLYFCAFISGGAKFAPETPALANGMLKNLAGVELKFTDCPVCGPSDVIARELEKLNLSFVVTLDEPVKTSLFELFFFEVRSIGFEPRSDAFDGRPPAIVIGGQVRFAASGDIVRAECDFHKLYLATPVPGSFLPRLKCEGLGLGLKLGGALEIEGKVVAVDGRMPGDLLVSQAPQERLKGNGFMGQGRIAIKGLPPFAASFGFVEIQAPVAGAPGLFEHKLAWFVYLEAQHLSYHFQLGPVPFFLREAGLGLGYHFTYVGIAAIDDADNLIDMIEAVDTIAATALEPAKLESWTASSKAELTLVGRLFISMSSASAPTEPLVWKPKEEAELPNVLLLNVVAAMRKTTFLMTANVWLGHNYSDWDKARHIGANGLAGKQTMTGYVLLAGARSEFLARFKSNPGAEVGPRLPMPQQFKDALKEIEYDATLYIRPGLLHFELGWPNRIRWSKNFAGVNVNVAGGAIFRVHEGAILAGLNLEGNLDFSMSARLDAGCVGVAVSASVYAALAARIIGYLDSQDIGRSLYYSLFSLQIRVRFEVSAWLEIDAWLCKITIRISFAFSLQIDVVAELALQGDLQMGTRVRATIGVSIFGRSLGLSVGLALNPGLVDSAAARVGRFMNMGLLQEVPSVTPDIATQDQDNAASARRGQERREARAAAGSANLESSGLARVPHEDPLDPKLVRPPLSPEEIIAIGPTDFQIVLTYPKVAPKDIDVALPSLDDYVYLSFLPKDAAPAAEGGVQRSSFYAAPRARGETGSDAKEPDHTIEIDAAVGADHVYVFTQTGWVRRAVGPGPVSLATRVDWMFKLDFGQSTEGSADGTPVEKAGVATLEQLFFAAFRTRASRPNEVTDKSNPYQEPTARPLIEVEHTPITRMSESTEQQYDRQERGYNRNMAQDPADRRCHEARDFLIQKFVSDLFELAADGRTPEKAHVLHVGLTLLVPCALATALADTVGLVRVTKHVHGVKGGACSAPCEVFNPPRLMFAVKPPRFSQTACRFEDNRARLDWDLRWDHVVEPEYFVQHYELTRWIEVDGAQVGGSTRITFKRADKVAEDADAKRRTVQRCEWQFTDEFEDMSPADKARLSNPIATVVLRYTVVPVCVSGTRGRPCSDFLAARIGMPQLAPVRRASAIMLVDPIPGGPKRDKLAAPRLRLKIEGGEDLLRPGDVRCWRILARAEAILPSGQYGSDGQTERALGRAIGALRARRSDDDHFDLPDGWNAVQHENDGHVEINALVPGLIAQLQDTAKPRAFTLMVQSVVLRKNPVTGKFVEVAHSPLALVELGIEVKSAAAGTGLGAVRNLKTRVDALELVRAPLPAEAYLLDPVPRVDLYARAGRAVLREPFGAGLGDLGSNQVLHPDFGGAVQLSWNVRPSALEPDALAPYRLRSGFDIYALDLDSGERASDDAAWASARAAQISSTQLLSASDARLTPPEVGEPSNWKVRYPSQAARRAAGGTWYSPAESKIVWPRPDIRREPLPEPSSELIKSLLRDGVPALISIGMVGGTGIEWRVSLENDPDSLWRPHPENAALLVFHGTSSDIAKAATELRKQLRRLRAEPKEESWAQDGFTLEQLRGWSLELAGMVETSDGKRVMLTQESLPMQFDRELHPLLEAIMARMRRLLPDAQRSSERLLDLDRRPPPVLKAKTVGEFMDETTPALDPYGWAVLDRLGLGVTLRLFDPVDDAFLAPAALHAQLATALAELQQLKLYQEAMRHLFVEELLQPGGMMDLAEFSALPDHNGILARLEDGEALRQDRGLSMLRLSVRPAIRKELQYRVWTGASAGTHDDTLLVDTDYFLPQLNEAGKINGRTFKAFLKGLEERGIGDSGRRKRHAQVVLLRGKSAIPGMAEDNEPGGKVDAFGRFATWDGWGYEGDPSLHCFRTALRNALRPEPDLDEGAEKARKDEEARAIHGKWPALNARFFEYAADPRANALYQYAYAAVEPSAQLQVAANSAGQVTVLLPETDGYAHNRAFAVLPQWRYARLLADAGHVRLDELLKEKRERFIVGGGQQNRYAIATVERTALIQPPEVLAVARLGDRVWWRKGGKIEPESAQRGATELRADGFQRLGTDPGDALPIVVRHHPELRLSKSNITPARGLALAGSLTSFVLTPADQTWCVHFLKPATLEALHRDDPDWAVDGTPDLLDQVAGMLGQAPAGSKIRVLRHMPHWYRHAVVMSAVAGGAVADTVSAYLADAPARLVEMDGGLPRVKAGHPWRDMLADDTIEPMPVLMYGTPQRPCFSIALPALLYRDTTDAVTAALWAGPIADLVDPGVIYDIALESPARELRPRASSVPLARITRGALESPIPNGSLKAAGNELSSFALSRDWLVECRLVSDPDAGQLPELHLAITPMSEPVAVEDMEAVLAGYPQLHDGVLRVPGGWSDAWIDEIVARLASPPEKRLQDAARLWGALAQANVGMPAAEAQGHALFPSYSLGTFQLARPATSAEWQTLAVALQGWLNKLARKPGALAALLHAHFEPVAAAIANETWPTDDPSGKPIAWLDTLPVPPDVCGWLPDPSPRMLVPELMTDQEYAAVQAGIGSTSPALAQRFGSLRQRQRERAMAGGALRIQATRGDAIPLQLALIPLT